jgi:hypothetical protein
MAHKWYLWDGQVLLLGDNKEGEQRVVGETKNVSSVDPKMAFIQGGEGLFLLILLLKLRSNGVNAR